MVSSLRSLPVLPSVRHVKLESQVFKDRTLALTVSCDVLFGADAHLVFDGLPLTATSGVTFSAIDHQLLCHAQWRHRLETMKALIAAWLPVKRKGTH